jgi:hypothetical protein
VYFDHSSRPHDRHKNLDRTPAEFFPAAVTRARRGDPLTPAENARRDAAPRGALAGAAPTSRAPLHLTGGEGRP